MSEEMSVSDNATGEDAPLKIEENAAEDVAQPPGKLAEPTTEVPVEETPPQTEDVSPVNDIKKDPNTPVMEEKRPEPQIKDEPAVLKEEFEETDTVVQDYQEKEKVLQVDDKKSLKRRASEAFSNEDGDFEIIRFEEIKRENVTVEYIQILDGSQPSSAQSSWLEDDKKMNTHSAEQDAREEDCGTIIVPRYSYNTTPRGTLHPTGSPPTMVAVTAASESVQQTSTPSSSRRPLPLTDCTFAELLADSGSDEDSNDEDGIDAINPEEHFRRFRQDLIEREEDLEDVVEENEREVLGEGLLTEREEDNVIECNEREELNGGLESNVSTDFHWTDDFTSFSGQRETYRRDPGPTFGSHDPVDIFLKFWDDDVMSLITSETNKYARQIIEQYTDPDINATIPKYLDRWNDVTIPILYQYFAVMICMSLCHRTQFQDYWARGLMEMPNFRQVMSRDEFLLITKFLHFVSDRETTTHGYARKIGKVAPIVEHCNKKFSELYIPLQHLSLDESLLLWKGRLSWRQCIRSKAARFGIKSFELCEATTGYLLKYRLYTGKETPMHPEPLHGFTNTTAKVVLELMEGYLDAGHILVMDNWYNQLSLTRYLKSRCTDVLGTINRTQRDVPQDLKDLEPNRVARGQTYARHCGDIALVAWKDVKLVTVVSTYHNHQMVPGRRAGVDREKPISVVDYNKSMCGVDRKDQKLSSFLFERKRCVKWYMKVFRRLVNTSLLNAFIIYTKNPLHKVCSHRDFRRTVAEGLLARFGQPRRTLRPAFDPEKPLRLQLGDHYPDHTELLLNNKKEHKRLSCVRCKAQKKRSQVRLMCALCKVPLCVGKCWLDYHSRKNLADTS